MNCCRVVSTILTIMSKDGAGVGADEFLPALIYTVIRANPDRLFSNLKYVVSFLQPSKLMSEYGYFITNVLSAVAFVRNIKESYVSPSAAEGVSTTSQASRARVALLCAGTSPTSKKASSRCVWYRPGAACSPCARSWKLATTPAASAALTLACLAGPGRPPPAPSRASRRGMV